MAPFSALSISFALATSQYFAVGAFQLFCLLFHFKLARHFLEDRTPVGAFVGLHSVLVTDLMSISYFFGRFSKQFRRHLTCLCSITVSC